MADPAIVAQQEISKNFPAFGSGRKLCAYNVQDPKSYNAEEGDATPNLNTTYNLYMLFYGFSFTRNQSQIRASEEEPILSKDLAVVFPAIDLPVEPKIGDTINDGTVVWIVKGVNPDPFQSVYELHVRPIEDL